MAKAPGRSVDPITNLVSRNSTQSNQIQFTNPVGRPIAAKGKPSNQIQERANDKGTGKEDIPSALALSGKRRLALKMPANFN